MRYARSVKRDIVMYSHAVWGNGGEHITGLNVVPGKVIVTRRFPSKFLGGERLDCHPVYVM